MVELLIDLGVDVNIKDSDDNTALDIAEFKGYDKIIARLRHIMIIKKQL
jgi:ankyrin repeat protein